MIDQAVTQPAVLTLDVGTSSVRALVFDGAGMAVDGATAQLEYRMELTPDGGVEFDADRTLELATQAIDDLLAETRGRLPIEAVAVTTYWHNVVGLDASDRPVTPIISWADTRPREALAELRRSVDTDDLVERTGCLVHASYLPAKLLWLRRADGETFRKAARWMSIGEYLLLKLTGTKACSYSMASGSGLLNGRTGHWDEQLLEMLGIGEEQLCPISERHEAIGTLCEPWRGRWTALADARWFPALGDGACSNLGAGCTTSTRMAVMIGTSGAMRLMIEGELPERLPRGLWRYHADRQRVLVGGALSNGGNLVDWMERTLRLPEPRKREQRLAESLDDAHGLSVLPFLAGERAPYWREDARGVISRIGLDTDAMDLYRAFLESVAYRFAEIDDLIVPLVETKPELIATGGALEKSPAWRQILADVLGRPVTASGVREGSSRGAALMALEALGAIGRLETIPPVLGDRVEPNRRRQERHRAARERHRQLYRKMLGDAKQ